MSGIGRRRIDGGSQPGKKRNGVGGWSLGGCWINASVAWLTEVRLSATDGHGARGCGRTVGAV